MFTTITRLRRYLFGSFWADLKYRYAGTSIGFFWFLINPLLEVAIYTAVFSFIINVRSVNQRPADYIVFLCAGLFPWLAFVENISKGTLSLVQNRVYLNRLSIPPAVFVAKNSLLSLFTLCIYLLLLIPLVLVAGYKLGWATLFVPIVAILFQIMGFGVSLILSHLHVLIPDIGEILNPITQLWRWTLPIIYSDEIFPEFMRSILRWNPPYYFLTSIRGMLMDQQMPSVGAWGWMLCWTVLFLVMGTIIAGKLYSDVKDQL